MLRSKPEADVGRKEIFLFEASVDAISLAASIFLNWTIPEPADLIASEMSRAACASPCAFIIEAFFSCSA